MLTGLKRPIAGLRKNAGAAPRRLWIEPLEARALLSATSVAGGLPPAPDFFELSSSLVNAVSTAPLPSDPNEFQSAMTGRHGISPEQHGPGPSSLAAHEPFRAVLPGIAAPDPRLLLFGQPRGLPLSAGGADGEISRLPSAAERPDMISRSFTPSSLPGWQSSVPPSRGGGVDSFAPPLADADWYPAIQDIAVDTLDSRGDFGREGGFIVLGNPSPSHHNLPIDPLPEKAEQVATIRTFARQDQSDDPQDGVFSGSVRLNAPSANELAGELGTLPSAAAKSLAETGSPAQGGLVAPSAFEVAGAANSSAARATQPAGSPDVGIGPRGTDSTGVRESSFSSEIARDDALPNFKSPLDRTRHSVLAAETDADFVNADAAAEKPIRSPQRSQHDSAPASSASEQAGSLESSWPDPGDPSESRESRESAFAAENVVEGTDEHPDGSNEAGIPVDEAMWAFESPEGGMIELVAAAFPAGNPRVASPQSSDGQATIGAQEIRMDKGVGLFQAFELATAPSRHADQFNATSDGESGAEPLAQATATKSAADDPAVEEAAAPGNEREEQPVYRAASLPAIVVASLAVAAGAARQEEASSERKGRRRFK